MVAGFVSVVILTRFLTPEGYGVFGVGMLAIVAGGVLSDGAFAMPLE